MEARVQLTGSVMLLALSQLMNALALASLLTIVSSGFALSSNCAV
jgi:hypothetical protein